MIWIEAAVRWYTVLVVVTWALAPGVRWLCRWLPDSGATIARPLAVLAAIYPAWLLANLGLAQFHGVLVWSAVFPSAALGWFVVVRREWEWRSWLRHLCWAEIASAACFAGYLWLRGFTPQIVGTEKPMDVAFLASSMRADVMPPPDPWFAGEPINYYYLGYVLHGAIARLADIPPEIGFNLALATVFSSTIVATSGLAWNVIAPWAGRRTALACATIAAFGLAIAGNLYAPTRLIQDASTTVSAWWWAEEGIGWRASRVVCDGLRIGFGCPPPATETINEFPFFSFLLGDLHPHLMALPYTITAIALAWNMWQSGQGAVRSGRASRLGRLALSGAIVGALFPINAWDLPTYLLLLSVATWIGAGAAAGSASVSMIVLVTSALLPWLPFYLTYTPPTTDALTSGVLAIPGASLALSAFSIHLGERTSLAEYLTIFGVPYAFGVSLVISSWRNAVALPPDIWPRSIAIIAAAIFVPSVLFSAPVLALCGIPLALACVLLKTIPRYSPRAFAMLLLIFAWVLSIGVEFVYLRDAFDDRMNTLFKVYFQVWTLYAVAGAVALAALWLDSRTIWRRTVVSAAAIASIGAGMAYPVLASYQWTNGFAAWQGLDGLAYGEETASAEVAAIRWLADHAAPGDVLVEAAGCSYYPFGRLPFNRVSAFTGVPTVIGWANHERQWRAGQPEHLADIQVRQEDVAGIFADPGGPLAQEYGVRWLFVGDYEAGNPGTGCESAGPYSGIAAASFPGSEWEEAFRSGDVQLFRRIDQ